MAGSGRAWDAGPTPGAATPASSGPIPDLAERLHGFRSLGGNCEFGFVQRYCGIEPSGLFRFSWTPIEPLIHGLETDFSEYGAPGDLEIVLTPAGGYDCRSRRYGIWAHTGHKPGAITPEALLEREYGRIAHLKRKMLADLGDGTKILVRKAGQGETADDFARLARALARHGPSVLLQVTEGPGPERVAWVADRVLAGHVHRLAPQEFAWDTDLESWVRLCDAAYAAVHGLPPERLAPAPVPDTMPFPARLRRHRGRRREAGITSFMKAVEPGDFDPAAIHVFSAWVWLPETFAAERVFALAGRDRLGWRDADLSLRRRWQRVWAAGRIKPGGERPPVGLAMIGDRGDRFWSCGARLHAGPVPHPAAPPPVLIEPAFFRWLAGWRG